MNWQEAMRTSKSGVIRQEDSDAVINGPSESVPDYDVTINSAITCGIPSEAGTQRLLEEFEIPRQGWK